MTLSRLCRAHRKFCCQLILVQAKNAKLENVALVNALQLEAARHRAVRLRFNLIARAKCEVAQAIRCRLRAFLLLIRVTLRCDLEL